MISTQDKNIKTLIAVLARTLSPKGKYKRNDIAKEWIFENSAWIAKEIYEGDHPKQLIGIKLSSPEFDYRTTALIEHSLALLMGQRALVDDCVLIDEQHWGEEYPGSHFDCGYETMYRFKNDLLKITIRHQSSSRSPLGRKSTATAAIRRQGSNTWKTIHSLKGNRIRSRNEAQYCEKSLYGPSNVHLFHKDEQELFGIAMNILQDQ